MHLKSHETKKLLGNFLRDRANRQTINVTVGQTLTP